MKQEVLRTAKILNKYPNDPIIRGKYCTLKKKFKKAVNEKAQNFKEKILQQISLMESNNPQKFWEMVNELRTIKQKSTVQNIEPKAWHMWFKQLNTEKYDILSSGDYFEKEVNYFEKEVDVFIKHLKTFSRKVVELLDDEITKEDILIAAKKLKNKKAVGYDTICNEMIKCLVKTKFIDVIQQVFNIVLINSCYPQLWKIGFLSPIFKSDDSFDPSNYRVIAVTSCFGKLFTLIINN